MTAVELRTEASALKINNAPDPDPVKADAPDPEHALTNAMFDIGSANASQEMQEQIRELKEQLAKAQADVAVQNSVMVNVGILVEQNKDLKRRLHLVSDVVKELAGKVI